MTLPQGGTLHVDVVLDGGMSDHGSVLIRSHTDGGREVVATAERSGWGRWAVDLELVEDGDRAELRGRVDGALVWLFGGPTTRVMVSVPSEAAISVIGFGWTRWAISTSESMAGVSVGEDEAGESGSFPPCQARASPRSRRVSASHS